MIKIGSFALVLLLSQMIWAEAEIQVTADVDRDRVALGDSFVVSVVVQSNESVEVQEPQIPNLTGLALLGRNESTSVQQSMTPGPQGMQWSSVRKKNFLYQFQAAQVGRLSLDAFEVVVNGKLYQTRPLLIEVLPEGQRPPEDQPQNPEEEIEDRFLREQDEIFNQLLRRHLIPQVPSQPQMPRGQKAPEYRSLPTNPNEAFFIQLEVDKTSVFEGEQVTATWYLVTRGQMETLDRAKFPALRGFWKEIIEENPQIQFFEDIINGVPFRKALMATHALFPIRAGKAIIDEFTVKSRIRMPTTGFGMGFGRAYEYTKSSKRLEINVKPLPTEGRPKEFTGSVGRFDVTSQVEAQQQFFANQPITIRVRFEGEGNAKTLELPLIEWPVGLELYDTKNESRFFKDGHSYKEFQILVIPRNPGPLEIPEIKFAYFNPKTEKYEVKTAPSISLQIQPESTARKSESGSFLGFQTEATKPKVLAMPALQKNFVSEAQSATGLGVIWPLLYLFTTLGLLGYGYKELRPRNPTVNLRKKLELKFIKVKKSSSLGNYRQVGAEVVNICNGLLAEVTSHKGEILEIQRMLELLPPELRAKCSESLLKLYEQAQVYGFAPEEVIQKSELTKELSQFVKSAESVCYEICKNWKPES